MTRLAVSYTLHMTVEEGTLDDEDTRAAIAAGYTDHLLGVLRTTEALDVESLTITEVPA